MALFKKKADNKKAAPSNKRRRSPAQYLREVYVELKKTTWPTPKELRKYAIAVIAFMVIAVLVIFAFDLGFQRLFQLLYS